MDVAIKRTFEKTVAKIRKKTKGYHTFDFVFVFLQYSRSVYLMMRFTMMYHST